MTTQTRMGENRYVALLRGINVGGNNLIKMLDLRSSFASMGFSDVQTYIQSGNVVFSSKQTNKPKLTALIEKALSDAFSYESRVVVISGVEMERVVSQAPKGFGKDPELYRYDVLFVREPFTTAEALNAINTTPGVDTAHAGDHAVYFRRLISQAAQSNLNKLGVRPAYKNITVRNWNTTLKLLGMILSASNTV
jgi:uncharacterized protein (DUF1697 family)